MGQDMILYLTPPSHNQYSENDMCISTTVDFETNPMHGSTVDTENVALKEVSFFLIRNDSYQLYV